MYFLKLLVADFASKEKLSPTFVVFNAVARKFPAELSKLLSYCVGGL